jgi:ribonuclease D
MEPSPSETETVSPPPYIYVDSDSLFHEALQRLACVSRLAIDIEADSLYHYHEKVCLIQISTDTETCIIDPLAVRSISELGPLMCDPAVEKVFHAASYDTYCLRKDYNFTFANIFDTHVAAQLLGHEFLGLSTLMESLLSIHHSKRRQRDDWSRRPLDPAQLEYAAMDTHHLLPLRDALETELREKDRLDWAKEEFEAAAAAERREREFDPEGFRKIKGNRELSPQDQGALRALFLFRDEVARKLDVPPFKVMNNSVLLDLVKRPPLSPEEVCKRRGVSNRVARKYSAQIAKLIDSAKKPGSALPEAPARNNWKPPDRAAKRRLEALRSWRSDRSKELGLQVGVVFPASLLENLAVIFPADMQEFVNVPGMRRWRARAFGEEVLRILREPKLQPTSQLMDETPEQPLAGCTN